MLDGVVLCLADGLHAAGLVLDIHVVEGHVEQVNAGDRTEIIIREIERSTEHRTPPSTECVPMLIMFVNMLTVVHCCILAPPQYCETCSLWSLLLTIPIIIIIIIASDTTMYVNWVKYVCDVFLPCFRLVVV